MADEHELEQAVQGREVPWERGADARTWVARSTDGTEEAIVRLIVGGEVEARVLKDRTGPSPGPDHAPLHGPQVFAAVEDALAYAESNLGPR